MSSINGISRVSKQMLNDFAEGKIDHIQCTAYSFSDGMVISECSGNIQSGGCKTQDGHLWFATPKGIVVVDPNNIHKNILPPPIVIERVVIDRVDYSPYEYGYFAPGNGQVEFHYGGLSFTTPQKVNFRYKLEGFDKEWRSVGTRHEAFYTNLPPREYVFRVTACNSDGVWNETGASFAFELKPHFYQTLWFYVFVLVVIIITVLGIYRWRVRQFIKREKQLEQHVLERRTVEEALAEERNLFRILIDNIPDGIYVKDTDCRITIANITDFHNMGAQSEAEVLGKTNFDFFPKDIAIGFHNEDQSVIQTSKPLINKEEFFLDKEGKKIGCLHPSCLCETNRGRSLVLSALVETLPSKKNSNMSCSNRKRCRVSARLPAVLRTTSIIFSALCSGTLHC
jgi:PAS domain-containing protein